MLANRSMPHISIEKDPTDLVKLINRYWETYPKIGPIAIAMFI
jgi:hypothetical protein